MALSQRDRAYIHQAALRYHIAQAILTRQILQESGGNERARSPAGALGIAQFMPATARAAGVNPLDPRSAIFGAARMDAQNLRKYGNWEDVLSLYNSGRGWAQGRNISETRNYVRSILGGAKDAAAGAPPQSAAASSSQDSPSIDPSIRAQLAQQLIANVGANARGQQPDLVQTLDLVSQLRRASSPSVSPAESTAVMPGATQAKGIAHFDGKPVAAWIAPILKAARAHGWTGTVSSGFRSLADQTRIYNSGARPAARPGTSNHEFTSFPGGAVDVTDAASLAAILRRLGIHTLQWAGAKDPVHFSHPRNGHY